MSLLSMLFRRRRQPEIFDPNPREVSEMPARPYTVLQAGLQFYSDPDCRIEVSGATMLIIRSDDPAQKHHPVECIPTTRNYRAGDIVSWEINYARQWASAWYFDPDTREKKKAWARAVEFVGNIVKLSRTGQS